MFDDDDTDFNDIVTSAQKKSIRVSPAPSAMSSNVASHSRPLSSVSIPSASKLAEDPLDIFGADDSFLSFDREEQQRKRQEEEDREKQRKEAEEKAKQVKKLEEEKRMLEAKKQRDEQQRLDKMAEEMEQQVKLAERERKKIETEQNKKRQEQVFLLLSQY